MNPIEEIQSAYYDMVFDTDREGAFEVVNDSLRAGISAESLVFFSSGPAVDGQNGEHADPKRTTSV